MDSIATTGFIINIIANEPKAITEKIKKNTDPITEPKTSIKNVTPESIKSKVTLSANDYNMGSFGGIKNLELTLANGSSYLLDKVTVEINYLNPEGNTVNFDKIFFQSINPGDIAVVPVKKSKRGVKIEYKIIKIEWLNNNSGNPESHTYSRN